MEYYIELSENHIEKQLYIWVSFQAYGHVNDVMPTFPGKPDAALNRRYFPIKHNIFKI